MAARACFGTDEWPADVAPPHATIEFEVAAPAAVGAAVSELEAAGYDIVHGAKTEPWGQIVSRLLSGDGLLAGISHTPWLHAP